MQFLPPKRNFLLLQTLIAMCVWGGGQTFDQLMVDLSYKSRSLSLSFCVFDQKVFPTKDLRRPMIKVLGSAFTTLAHY